MISFWENWGPGATYREAPADEPAKLIAYRRHVANGTVPKSGIPYTLTGIEAYRHKSSIEKYKPGMVLPNLTSGWNRDTRTVKNIPDYRHQSSMAGYRKEFDRLNGLRSF